MPPEMAKFNHLRFFIGAHFQSLLAKTLRRFKMHSFNELVNKDIKNMIKLNSVKLAKFCNDPAISSKDMEQEFCLELFRRFPEFQPEKSSFYTFTCHVINNHASWIIHKNYARKRGGRNGKVSLYEEEANDDSDETITLLEQIDGQDAIHIMGGNALSMTDRIERMKEVRTLIDSLPERLRMACELIMDGKSISETIAELRISRASFYYQTISPLKKLFAQEIFS
ncbi:MAG: hypothetical protein PHF33_10835 [Candidatus Delongbacteria bacterium]|nr:hypothetical protein [Candidatus Delongbacteria bacterium]